MFGITPPIIDATPIDELAFNVFVTNEISKEETAAKLCEQYSSYKYFNLDMKDISKMVKEKYSDMFTEGEMKNLLNTIYLRRGY